jgi:hypothetical protein
MTNHDDLERRLRSQRGPREDGYIPSTLPASVDAERQGELGASPLLRASMLVGVALAGALAVAAVGGMLSGRSPGVGTNGTTPAGGSASASPPDSPGSGTCEPSDVTLTSEAWGGAAGSRGTVATITLAAGRPACILPAALAVQIHGADGTLLVSGESVAAGGPVSLEPGAAFASGIAWSNWCGSDPAAPVTVALRLGSWASWEPVNVPAGGVSPIPPCLGDGPTTLSVSEFQLRP